MLLIHPITYTIPTGSGNGSRRRKRRNGSEQKDSLGAAIGNEGKNDDADDGNDNDDDDDIDGMMLTLPHTLPLPLTLPHTLWTTPLSLFPLFPPLSTDY